MTREEHDAPGKKNRQDGLDGSHYRGLAVPLFSDILRVLGDRRPAIVGVTGPPGVGKSTLCQSLLRLASESGESNARVVALEDYYHSRAEREARGLRWRAVPGSHRLTALRNLLSRVRVGMRVDTLPRYDLSCDEAVEPERVDGVISTLFLDGWLLRIDLAEYRFIGDMLDYLVYLDADVQDSRRWRLDRERTHRLNREGYSDETMSAFWDEALQPVIERWVCSQRDRADSVVLFNGRHEVERLIF